MSDDRCPLCEQTVTATEAADPRAQRIGGLGGNRMAHRECLLRSSLGGIGHLEDHALWCVERHDPDGLVDQHRGTAPTGDHGTALTCTVDIWPVTGTSVGGPLHRRRDPVAMHPLIHLQRGLPVGPPAAEAHEGAAQLGSIALRLDLNLY